MVIYEERDTSKLPIKILLLTITFHIKFQLSSDLYILRQLLLYTYILYLCYVPTTFRYPYVAFVQQTNRKSTNKQMALNNRRS